MAMRTIEQETFWYSKTFTVKYKSSKWWLLWAVYAHWWRLFLRYKCNVSLALENNLTSLTNLMFHFRLKSLSMKLKWKLASCRKTNLQIFLLFFFFYHLVLGGLLHNCRIFFFSPPPFRHGAALRARDRRCMSWWRGSGRHLRSTDRPAPSAAKATSTCRKNVNEKKSLTCIVRFVELEAAHLANSSSPQLVINMIAFSRKSTRMTSVRPCRSSNQLQPDHE